LGAYNTPYFFSLWLTFEFVKNPNSIIRFGLRLRKLREEKNMSQQDLADESELDKKTIQRIETGKLNPTLDTIICLSNGLGIKLAELIEV